MFKNKSIPVNSIVNDLSSGIAIERASFKHSATPGKAITKSLEEGKQSHRHNAHAFFMLEKGTVSLEVDFKKYKMKPCTVIYIHPNQVHRTIILEKVTVSSWSITNEKLNAEYLKLLEDITPAKPLALNKETFAVIAEAISLCIKFTERKNDKLYHSLLKDGCNALVALVIAQYLKQAASFSKLSRFETVTKAFKKLLEHNYITDKRPVAYARQMHLSTPYLNECIKYTTGNSVSYHIQQRIILEAKRLLYHSDKTVKEIAADLGYDDYPYFSRLFTKIAGISAAAFRNKNRG